MRKLRIAGKLFVCLGIFLAMTALVGAVSYYGLETNAKSLANYADRSEVVSKNHEFVNWTLQARRAEKDFFMRGDVQYVKRHAEVMERAYGLLDEIDAREITIETRQVSRKMRKQLEVYEAGFVRVVAGLQEIGTEETGAYGRFRALARRAEGDLGKTAEESLLISLLMLRRHEKDYLLRGEQKYVEKHSDAAADLLRQIEASAKLGEDAKRSLAKSMKEYAAGFQALVNGKKEVATETAAFRAAAHKIEPDAEALEEHIRKELVAAREQSLKTRGAVTLLMIGGVLIASILGAAVVVYVARQLSADVARLVVATSRVAEGDLEQELEVVSSDEIGSLTETFGKMVQALKKNRDTSESQDWLKSGIARVNETMRGEEDSARLAAKVVSEISTYLDAKVGALYLQRQENGQQALALLGSYAYTKRKNLSSRFRIGEGLVGQAALEKQQILVKNVPEDYVRVVSGLGESLPRFICVTPLVYEDQVRGVLEVGTLGELSEVQLEYLNQAMPAVAITFETARSREALAESLQESEQLSQDLQTQQAALQTANEELEEQTQALQQSEEKLKVQQEELEVINEELEEKNKTLTLQKREVESAQKAITEKAEELALASKYKSEFLANMSHELRTPLNSLLLLARSLRDNKDGNLTAGQVESAGIIYGSGNDLLSLINEILDLAKIEAGRMSLEIDRVPLGDLAQTIRDNFTHMSSEKGLELNVELLSDVPKSVATDSKKLQQVLTNLISNALKFTEKGRIDVRFHVPPSGVDLSRSGLDPRRAVAISVADTGIGIAKEHQKVIFEAFQQADGTTSRRFGGTGLGLSISRELARLLGGEIQVQSEVGKGSTFTVYLPHELKAPEQGALPSPAAAPPADRAPATDPRLKRALDEVADDRDGLTPKDKSILIIEDDVNFARSLVTHCHQKGLRCLVALTGEEGLVLARRYMPDAAILDIRLPGIDGWRVLERIKEDTHIRHIPVHVMSVEEPSTKAFRKGAIGHLQKPVTQEGIEGALNKIEQATSTSIKRVLVVEDDEDARRGIVDLVSGKDVEVDEAAGANDAIEALLSTAYDCMILDLGLWDMDGEKLLEAIKEDKEAHLPPVIVYTGRALSREEEMRLREYTESIIIKDVRSEERLLDEVSLFLHRVVDEMPPRKRQVIIDLHNSDALFQSKKVLIVEDDMRSSFALSKLLAEHGMSALKAENGEKALKMLDANPDVDLVLMDIMMPVMDGYETMDRIRADERFAKLPIVALTAKAMKGDAEKCLAAGANDYLAKPVDEERLFSIMRVWLYG